MKRQFYIHGKPSELETTCKGIFNEFGDRISENFFKRAPDVGDKKTCLICDLRTWRSEKYSVYSFYAKGKDYSNRDNGYCVLTLIVEGMCCKNIKDIYDILRDKYQELETRWNIIKSGKYVVDSFGKVDAKTISEEVEAQTDRLDYIDIPNEKPKMDFKEPEKFKPRAFNPYDEDVDSDTLLKAYMEDGRIYISEEEPTEAEKLAKLEEEKKKEEEKERKRQEAERKKKEKEKHLHGGDHEGEDIDGQNGEISQGNQAQWVSGFTRKETPTQNGKISVVKINTLLLIACLALLLFNTMRRQVPTVTPSGADAAMTDSLVTDGDLQSRYYRLKEDYGKVKHERDSLRKCTSLASLLFRIDLTPGSSNYLLPQTMRLIDSGSTTLQMKYYVNEKDVDINDSFNVESGDVLRVVISNGVAELEIARREI